MKIELNRDCLLECWNELEERNPTPFEKGTTFEVEDFSDEYYIRESDEEYGDIYIPKLSCSF